MLPSTAMPNPCTLCARRIQEFSRTVGVDRVKVQLWDCSGSMQYQAFWPVLAKVGAHAANATSRLAVRAR